MLTTILNILTKVLDVAIVWFMLYQLLKYARTNFKLTLIFKGVFVIFILKFPKIYFFIFYSFWVLIF